MGHPKGYIDVQWASGEGGGLVRWKGAGSCDADPEGVWGVEASDCGDEGGVCATERKGPGGGGQSGGAVGELSCDLCEVG